MKKRLILALLWLALPLFVCVAGGTRENSVEGTAAVENSSQTAGSAAGPGNDSIGNPSNLQEEGMNALVVYFSWSGNTRTVATEIQSRTGADMFELIPQQPYTDDYNELLDVAQRERRNHARPAIANQIADIDAYDVIFLGYPNWWADMPMIIYSFLDQYDLSGKTVAPFCTSGGSGLSGTVRAIKSLEPEANVVDGLHVGGSSASRSGDIVARWLGGLGFPR